MTDSTKRSRFGTPELLVASDARLSRDVEGKIRASSPAYAYAFWARYLEEFPRVTLLARVETGADPSWPLVEGPGLRVEPLRPYGALAAPLHFLRTLLTTIKALRRADAVLARLPGHVGAVLLAMSRLLRKPFAIEVVGDPWEVFGPGTVEVFGRRFFRWFFARQLRWACRNATSIGYISSFLLPERYPPGPGALVRSYSSVRLLDEAFVSEPASRLSDPGKFVLLCVGSMAQRYKGIDTFLESVAICREQSLDVEAVVVGEGRYRSEFEEVARRLRVPVRFTGQLAGPREVQQEMRRANLFVSASRTEGLPRVIIEAMASGLAVVATDVGSVRELLPAEATVARDDPAALAEKIIHFLRSPGCLEDAARRNLDKAQAYRPEKLRSRRVAVYGALRQALGT